MRQLSRAEAAALEPDVPTFPDTVLQFADEGAAEAGDVALAVLRAAQNLGAQVISGVRVTGLRQMEGRIVGVDTDMGAIDADHVVVAAGTGAADILATADVALPMLTRPGAIVCTKPVDIRISSVLVTPEGEVRQLPDGRLISPAAANHQSDVAEVIETPLEEIAEATCARLARLIGVDHLAWDDVAVANRPVPQDGLPVIGLAGDGLSVAVMHSGVTLAAITGELIADLVTKKASNAQMAMLAPYSIDRFNAG